MQRPERPGRDEPEERDALNLEEIREFCEDALLELRRYTREKPLRGLAGAFLVGALIGLVFRSGR